MKILDIIQEILLGLSIAILIPITIYWGVYSLANRPEYKDYVTVKTESTKELSSEEKELYAQQRENWEKADKEFQVIIFYVYIIIGLLSILIGSFISINSLAIGLIGGGILNLIMSIAYRHSGSFLNFVIFLSFLIAVILISIVRKKKQFAA